MSVLELLLQVLSAVGEEENLDKSATPIEFGNVVFRTAFRAGLLFV
jgi:hypothetical protein